MNCPICEDSKMREVEKDGVLIDICPSCKGVWLDRGELNKLMEGVREVREQYNEWADEKYRREYDYERRGYDHDRRKYDYGRKPRRKKSVLDVLGDLFD